jgi:c-di-GMP-binding flagellar brake protein YcgR
VSDYDIDFYDLEAAGDQRREHVRMPLELKFWARSGYGSNEEVEGKTIDISGKGMLAKLPGELWPEDEINIDLYLPEGDVIELVARVARITEQGIGLEYIDILPGHRERIIRLVFKRMQQLLEARARTRLEGDGRGAEDREQAA